jgi:predicted phosphoadenosine phosphosulfate sulfurtransferase
MKLYLQKNVYEAAIERLGEVYKLFDNIAIAYSGGKDSGVILWLVLNTIPKNKRCWIYFVDKESNLITTKDYILRQFDEIKDTYPYVNILWFCLPLKEINALSFYDPYYYCWDKSKKDLWIYDPPNRDYVITEDNNVLKNCGYDTENKYVYGAINNYISDNGNKPTAVVVGLRADESLNRYRAVTKHPHFNLDYITKVKDNIYNTYPIYDWDIRDVMKYYADNNIELNPIYHKMWLKGVFKREMRISQSFAGVPKKTLPIYRELEPESFEKFLKRVNGINSLTHIDLNTIKKLSDNIDYDYLYQCLPDVYQKALDKTKRNTKDKETIKAILNGDIRLKRKAQKNNNTEKIKEKYKEIL